MIKTRINAELVARVCEVFEKRIPFNKVLGLRLDDVTSERAKLSFDMREELIGNFLRGSLHGGVISAVLDTVGGLVAFVSLLDRLDSEEAGVENLANVGTIDLRIDYLRSGVGTTFVATGATLRAGSKVAVTRMELHNDLGILVAVGTGTYLIG